MKQKILILMTALVIIASIVVIYVIKNKNETVDDNKLKIEDIQSYFNDENNNLFQYYIAYYNENKELNTGVNLLENFELKNRLIVELTDVKNITESNNEINLIYAEKDSFVEKYKSLFGLEPNLEEYSIVDNNVFLYVVLPSEPNSPIKIVPEKIKYISERDEYEIQFKFYNLNDKELSFYSILNFKYNDSIQLNTYKVYEK